MVELQVHQVVHSAHAGQVAVSLSRLLVYRGRWDILAQRRVRREPDARFRVQVSRSIVIQSRLVVHLFPGKPEGNLVEAVRGLFYPELSVGRVFYALVLSALVVCDELGAAHVVSVVIIRVDLGVAPGPVSREVKPRGDPGFAHVDVLAFPHVRVVGGFLPHAVEVEGFAALGVFYRALAVGSVGGAAARSLPEGGWSANRRARASEGQPLRFSPRSARLRRSDLRNRARACPSHCPRAHPLSLSPVPNVRVS